MKSAMLAVRRTLLRRATQRVPQGRTGSEQPTELPQDGYVLISVIGIMLLLMMISVAILAYVLTALGLTRVSIERANRIRQIDSALEMALHQVREDQTLCSDPGFKVDQSDVRVTCVSQNTSNGIGQRVRIVELSAERESTAVGWATVRITDLQAVLGSLPSGDPDLATTYGFSVEVCDWQLGTKQTAQPLIGCS